MRSTRGDYGGNVKGTKSFWSPEQLFKYRYQLGENYPNNLFKNDMYGAGY
jgi:hypothetical protein